MTTTTKKPTTTKKAVTCRPDKVVKGHILSLTYHCTVTSSHLERSGKRVVAVQDLDDSSNQFQLEGADLIARCLSADYYEQEAEVSRTELIRLLVGSAGAPITVEFVKKDGSPRILRGRWIKEESGTGYSYCDDLEVQLGEVRLREVDHRTLKALIVNGTRYTVRGGK